jgi:hypothetical protein
MKYHIFFKKNRLKIITIAVVLVAALLGTFYYISTDKFMDEKKSTQDSINQTTTESQSNSDTSPDSATSDEVVTETKVEDGGVVITSPIPGAFIEPGVTEITGTVTSKEGGELHYMVKGANSGVLVDTVVNTIPEDSVDYPYIFTLSFDKMPKDSGSAVLEVYLMNGTDRLGYADVGVKI